MAEIEWQRMAAHQLRVLAGQDAVVILPIASIEQHGPHLPTMTDTRLGHEVAVRAARKVAATRPVVVTPVVWSGLSEHHMPFGGTLTVSAATLRAVLTDLIASITRLGFRKILLSNSHGGNIIAMQQLCDELSPDCAATIVATTYAIEAGPEIAALLEDQDGVQHAGEAETSMMLACQADLVDTQDLAAIGTPGEGGPGFLKAGRASYRWRPFAHATVDGVSGTPEKSTAEKGEALLEASAEGIAALILDAQTWAPPDDRRGKGTAGVPFTS
ncbi:creatininase family protein [Sulfitobacter sp. JB4-11]|uniref:creatininase family protein n=1 Tax=Sulfitobacter rhodophyticola TaxID=3238304 RepID=UPI003516705A